MLYEWTLTSKFWHVVKCKTVFCLFPFLSVINARQSADILSFFFVCWVTSSAFLKTLSLWGVLCFVCLCPDVIFLKVLRTNTWAGVDTTLTIPLTSFAPFLPWVPSCQGQATLMKTFLKRYIAKPQQPIVQHPGAVSQTRLHVHHRI